MRKPFWKSSHSCWYLTDPKTARQIRLDPDEEKAHDIWQQIRDAQSCLGPTATYRRRAEQFLDENYDDRDRFKWDATKIAKFAEYVGNKLARDITKRDVVKWLNEKKPGQRRKNKGGEWVDGKPLTWGPTTKRDAYSAICRVYKWAVDEGHLSRNPIKGVKLDPPRKRQSTITPEQYTLLLGSVDPEFPFFSLLVQQVFAQGT